MPLDWTGIDGKIADTLNDIIALNDKTSLGIDRISKVVGKGRGRDAHFRVGSSAAHGRARSSRSNALISDLVWPNTEMARGGSARPARGGYDQKMDVEVDRKPIPGRIYAHPKKSAITMVDQLGAFVGR